MFVTPFSNARGNSKVQVRYHYIGNEVTMYVKNCAQTFRSKLANTVHPYVCMYVDPTKIPNRIINSEDHLYVKGE